MTGIDILSDISSGPRLEILKILQEKSLKASVLSKKMKTSIQAISRHLDKLVESNLIEKTSSGEFNLTTIAKIALSQIPFFEFLSKNKTYFEDHDFTGIPDHLISRMGDLVNCKLEPDFMKSIQMAREFCMDANEFIYSATCTLPMEVFDIFIKKKKNFQWHNVYGSNTIVAKGFSKYPARKNFLESFNSQQVGEKIVKNIPIIVAVSEKGCQLLFSNKKFGQADGKGGVFFGSDKKSIQWCMELADYYWNMPEIKNFTLKEL